MKPVEFITGNTGVLVVTMLFVIAAIVLTFFAFLMKAQGLSLRPLIWFGAVFLAIVVPQLIGHLHKALNSPKVDEAATSTEWWNQNSEAPTDDTALVHMLGPEATGSMVSDFAPMLTSAGLTPRWARFVIFRGGQSVVLANFSDSIDASRGVSAWLEMSGLTAYVHGDSSQGFSGARPAGDRIFARAVGRHMVVWSASDFSSLKALVAASRFPANVHDGMIPEQDDFVADPPPFGLSWPAAFALLFGYAGLVSILFLKGAAWASALPAQASPPIAIEELRSRLLSVGGRDVPFTVSSGGQRDQITVEWRYADARWVDFMRAHAMRRVHKLVMRLDADSQSVYVVEYQTAWDASAGADGARLNWAASMGINFMQIEHQRVFGLQIDPSGRPTGELQYAWTFNLQEMKSPLQEVITKSGWNWRPVLWDAPPPFEWFFR